MFVFIYTTNMWLDLKEKKAFFSLEVSGDHADLGQASLKKEVV